MEPLAVRCDTLEAIERKKKLVLIIWSVAVITIIIIIIIIISFANAGALVHHNYKYTGFKVFPEGNVCFNPSDPSSYRKYETGLQKFIQPYHLMKLGGRVINCFERTRQDNEICIIEHTWIYPCGGRNGWGYRDGTPCFIFYYSNDSTFTPTSYKTLSDLPSDIPEKLRENMENEEKEHGSFDPVVYLYCSYSDPYWDYR